MNVKHCSEWEELAALRLYGELERDEEQRLAAHLECCASCRTQARELERGLGRLRTPAPVAARRSAPPLLVPLAAFAAGVLCALGWSAFAGPQPVGDAPASPTAAPTGFARATPPPPTRDRGLGAVLAAVARR